MNTTFERNLTIQEVAVILRLDRQAVMINIKTGGLRAWRIGKLGHFKIKESDLKAFIDKNYENTHFVHKRFKKSKTKREIVNA